MPRFPLFSPLNSVQPMDIVVGDFPFHFGRDAGEVLFYNFTRAWPRGSPVREVRRPHEVVRPGELVGHDARTVVLKSRIHLPFEILARPHRDRRGIDIAQRVVTNVKAIEIVRDPADVIFR